METDKKGIILILGDSIDGFSEALLETNPQAFGFLCYTNQGLAKSTEFIRGAGIDLSCCQFEVIHGLSDKKEFFRKSAALADFLTNQCRAEITSIYVSADNLEALALAAVVAHQNQTVLRVYDRKVPLVIDSSSAMLLNFLSTIVKEFNLFHYRDVLTDIDTIRPKIKSSKGKVYVSFLATLAQAYHDWDCRRYSEACKGLKKARELLESNKDDFSHIYDYFRSKLQWNIDFLERLSKYQAVLGAIDAFFNGNRRYDAADNLVCILALSNSVEFCLRARMLTRNYDPDDFSNLTKSLIDDFRERAREFFIKHKIFHVKAFYPSKEESVNAVVIPGLSHKPGFLDLLQILELIEDEFFKEIAGIVNAPENADYMGIMQLNTLRNKVVHRMGSVDDEDLHKAIKLTEYVIEKFVYLMAVENPEILPTLKLDGSDSLMLQIAKYATHARLNLRDFTRGMFS
jgi:hypothetical protein